MARTYRTVAIIEREERNAVRTNDLALLRDLLDRADRADPEDRPDILVDVASVATDLAAHERTA